MASELDNWLQEKPKGNLKSLLPLAPYLKRHVKYLLITILVMLVGALANIALPAINRTIVDDFIAQGRAKGLLLWILLAVGIFSLLNVTNSIRARLMAKVGQDTIRVIREDLFTKLQVLPVKYFDRVPVGKLITRLTSDVDALADLVSNAVVTIIIDSLKLLGFLAVMLWLDWRLTIVTLVFVPLLVFAFTYLHNKIHEAEDRAREQASIVNAITQEDISGMKVIQAFEAQEYFDRKFAEANRDLLRANLRATLVFSFFWPIVDLNWVLSIAALILFGGRWVLDGTTTIGTLIAFIGYSGQFFGPLRGLSQAYRIIQRALAGAVRINEIFSAPSEVDSSLPPMPPIKGDVEFVNVSFGYDDELVLKDINISAKAGETVALVGHTGAGKTSIINLLCRFYTPQAGKILVDGHDIFQRELTSYRKQIGLVLQEPFLFSGTLRDNLLFGAPNASDEELWEALEAVGLAESFRQQGVDLDTMLTERGSNFSTGQRQLLSFARALLANPRILILDEATAHVDTLTEQKVQAALRVLLKGRTSFVIAHRLSTIRNADQIVVMGHGRIIEKGSHEELLALKGEYWQLCNAQADAMAVIS